MLLEALPRIKDAFDVVLKRHDFCNALKLARVYRNCSDVPDSDMLMEALATDNSTPALCRAEAQALIAQKLGSLEKREEQDRLYANALQCFKDEGHSHGSLDIKIAKLCRYPLDPKEDQFEEKIAGLLKEYEALDYPAGLGSAYLELLGLAQVLHNFEVQTVTLNELERLFIASGSRLTWFMIRNSTFSRWVLTGADRGKVIIGATALWNELAQSDCSVLRGQAAQTVSHAYYALKDPEMTAEWSRKAQQDWPQTNLTAIPLARGFDPRKTDQLAQFYERTIQLVEHDITRQSPEDAVEKLAVFLNQALTTRNQNDESIDVIKRALSLMEEYIPSLSDPSMAIRQRAHLRQSQGSLLVMMSTLQAEIDLELAALQAFKEAKDLYLKENLIGQAAIVLQHQALVHLSIFQKFERRNDPETHQALENALKLFRVTLDSVKSLGLVALSWENSYWVAHCQYRQWRRGSCPAETLSDSLRSAERFVDQQRQEVSILSGIEAVSTKRRLSSDEHVRNIYRFAIDVFHRRDDWQEAWQWVQKSKARSLSDLLGLGALVPQSLIDRIQEQKTTRDLYEGERKLFERLSAASDIDRFPMRIQLEHHQKTMKEHHHLKELLNMREGVPVPLEELRVASSPPGRSRQGRGIVFVDWFIAQFDISVVVIKSDGEIAIRTLPITAADIQDWVSKYISGGTRPGSPEDDGNALSGLKEDDEADEGPLRQLDILVAPLNDLSSSDDLLVFCPTGILHSIPLHALRVGPEREREILITRNPIVYCASLTSFAQCCRQASLNTPGRNSSRKSLLAVYEPWPDNPRGHGAFNHEEQQEVYSSVRSLAQDLKGESFSGDTVTSDIVRHCLELSHLIHFHGHCDFEKEIIAEQSLQISGGPNIIGKSIVYQVSSIADPSSNATHQPRFRLGISSASASRHATSLYSPVDRQLKTLKLGTSRWVSLPHSFQPALHPCWARSGQSSHPLHESSRNVSMPTCEHLAVMNVVSMI
jgi:tetratricopeptide (TPR) repeat protein